MPKASSRDYTGQQFARVLARHHFDICRGFFGLYFCDRETGEQHNAVYEGSRLPGVRGPIKYRLTVKHLLSKREEFRAALAERDARRADVTALNAKTAEPTPLEIAIAKAG
jgi:hypothetical protein